MEEKQRKSFNIFKISFLPYIFFVVAITLSIICLIILNNNKNISIELNKLNQEYNKLYNDNSNKLSDINNIKQNIEFIDNIKENISNIQNEYNNNAKILETKVLNMELNYKIMYLTFDDGPYVITPDFLQMLKNYDIQATFFVLMKYSRLDIYKQQAIEGHNFGNHTAYHNLKAGGLYKSTDEFIQQINLVENFLIENVGFKPEIARFPGGTNQAKKLKNSIIEALHNKGYKYVDWNASVGDGDGTAKTASDAFNLAKSTTENKNVVVMLMHDYSTITLKALPNILDYFKDEGYIFLPLFKSSSMLK